MREYAPLVLSASLLLTAGIACGADGVVLDPAGRPVSGATARCAGRTAVTGSDGHFQIPGVERCQAAVAAAGFETIHIEIVSGTKVQLAIAPLVENIVVSATRFETAIEELGMAATVVSRSDLEQRQAPQLGDSLRTVPGVQIVRYGRPGGLTQVFTRGGQRTGSLLLVDGIPMNDPGGELNLSGFGSSSLDRIEVVRGPESALFGAQASSAVVQVFTAHGDPERTRPRGAVSYDRGSFGTDHWTASLNGGLGGKLDYAVGAEQYHTVGEYPNDYFRNTSGTANVGYRLAPSTEIRGVLRSYDSALGAPDRVGYGLYNFTAGQFTRTTAFGVRLDDVRGSRFVQRASFHYRRARDLYLDPDGAGPYTVAALVRDVTQPVPRVYLERLVDPSTTTAPAGLRLVKQSVWPWPSDPSLLVSTRSGGEYQGTLTQAGGATVFGYQFERQSADVSGSPVDRDNHGVFLHHQQTLWGRLFLSGGARMEHNSAFGTEFTPRAAASYRVSKSTYLRASAGLGITDPSMLQNYARDPWYVGNPNLKPEKTTSFEGGVVQELFARRVRAEASLFANSYKNLITFILNQTPSTWQNIEASRARGIEVSAQAKLTRLATLSGSYTRMWTKVTFSNSPNSLVNGTGQELPRRPGNAGVLTLSVSPKRFSVQTGAVLVGERQDQDLFGVTRNPGYQNVFATGSFRLNKHLTPYLRIENLLNQRYSEILGYTALSRAAYGGLRLEW